MKRSNRDGQAKVFRVLLVDDNRNGLLARKSVLEEHGYEVHAHSLPLEAVAAFQQEPYDLVVTDYRMPRMTGAQLIVEVRAVKPDVPIVLVSGVVDVLGLDEKSTGADVVIPKSSTEVTHLVRAVNRLLEAPAAKKPVKPQSASAPKARKKTG
ncbi:MAG TPA: response regulator [Bryobacteraceae bacterium]|nr:response regulator [Bryobacteraceae bacterium]